MTRDKILKNCENLHEHEVIPSDFRVHELLENLHSVSEKIQQDLLILIYNGVPEELCDEILDLATLLEEVELRWNHTRFQHPEGVKEWCAVNRDGYEIFHDLVNVLGEAFHQEEHLLEDLELIVRNPNSEEMLLEIPKLVHLGHANHQLLEKVNCGLSRLEEAALIGHELSILYQANRIIGSIPRDGKVLRDRIATYAHSKLELFSDLTGGSKQ